MAIESTHLAAPALILNTEGYGSLAAVRCLGRAGVPVAVAGGGRFSPARVSRFASHRLPAVDGDGLEGWLGSLLWLGRKWPGHVLCPEDDTWLWWMALHREQLAANFRHALPPAGAVYRLLDKKLLGEAARLAGLATPETWSPQSERDILDLRATGTFPVVIKPRTHVGLVDWKKGQIVRDPRQFVAAYREMRRRGRFAPELAAMNPSVDWPIVQRYRPLSDKGIYNVVGFVDRSGELFVAQATWKLLQAPRHLGIGVVFEAAPLDPTLAEGIRRLCVETGFHGIFEVEFLPFEGRMLLIDFNPRYFHGMALPIARGLPLPMLGYLDAIGDTSGLRSTVAAIAPPETTLGRALVFGLELNTILIAQRLTRGLTLDEANRLRRFLPKHRTGVVDGVRDANDPEVWRAHTVRFVARALTRPRTFAGTYALNR